MNVAAFQLAEGFARRAASKLVRRREKRGGRLALCPAEQSAAGLALGYFLPMVICLLAP
jgi:hypothetical protein